MNAWVKVSLRYGVLAGIIGSGIVLGLYYMGRHPILIPVYLDFRIILIGVFIFFALREVRDYYQNGILYFWQGILVSFLITACFAVIALVAIVVFIQFVPAFLSEYIQLETVILKSLPAEEIERIGKDIYEGNLQTLPTTRASDLGLLYFLQSFLISLFVSIILSVTLRRQPQT